MNAEILNVLEQPIFDSAIVNFEKRTHDPYSSKNLNNNDEIHISIQQQDTYTAPYFSVLYIRGRLCRAADGMPSQTATLDRMGVLLLFSEIRYVMNAETVDKSRNPGLTALMKGYASFNQNECMSLENAGWSPDPHFFDANVFLNSESYPYDNLKIDFSKNFYVTLYDMYAQFQSSYYQKENEPYLTTYTFKHLAPLVVVDCSCQKEVLKNGAVDIRLEINTKQNIPKDTAAYCLIIHDKIIRYTPLTSLVRTY
ncbi:hypothetical protein NQ318_015961 [Aromia moschata]|uniref:Double jelly roll-like domain-containing protein n=1 Tax=Aromia moschata TaxID=1265417 RepID=A0AAV8X480_9CUCU|nr:hypothetical protein NQ318_015961 [Aromia moschata]